MAQVTRGHVLVKAQQIINGERQDQYGNPENSFKAIGELWTMYLKHRGKNRNSYEGVVTIGPKDVALMMVLFKIARELNGAGKEDNLIDAAGYLGLAADVANYGRTDTN